MIKAKTERMGTDTMIKGFVWELSPAEMLIVNVALQMFAEAEDRHQDDREWARKTLNEIQDSIGGDSE